MIVAALKRNSAFDKKKHGNPFNKLHLKSGDIDTAEWLRFQAFTTAVVEDEKLRQRIKKELANALENGQTKKQFLDALPAKFAEYKSKLKTTFETNQALAFGAAQQAKLIEVADDFPYWRYSAIMDAVTRPSHAALHDKIFEVSDQRFYPPIGFNCRCTAIPLTAAQAGRINPDLFMRPGQELNQPLSNTEFMGNKQQNFVKWLQTRAAVAEPETRALIDKAVNHLLSNVELSLKANREAVKDYARKNLAGKALKTGDLIEFELTMRDIKSIISHRHDKFIEKNNLLKKLPKVLAKSELVLKQSDVKGNEEVHEWLYYKYREGFYLNFKRLKSGKLKLYAISDKIK